jgi:uncharacterized membrane protein
MNWLTISRYAIFAIIGGLLAHAGVNFGESIFVLLLSAIACMVSYLEGADDDRSE